MLPEGITPSISYATERADTLRQGQASFGLRSSSERPNTDGALHTLSTFPLSDSDSSEGVAQNSTPQQRSGFENSPLSQLPPADISESTRKAFASRNIRIAFELDSETQRMFIALRDMQTGELIRQIPPEEQLRWAQRIDAYLQSLQEARQSDTGNEKGLLLSTQA